MTHLASHPENTATLALKYVLDTSSAARAAFESYLRQAVALPTGLLLELQSSGEDRSIPDLAGLAEDGSSPLLAEAKFYAGLTDHQPVSYLHRLRVGAPGMLLFIVPSQRLELLWIEVARRAAREGFPVGEETTTAELRHAAVGHGHVLAMVSWRALLNVLTAAATAAGDQTAAADLDQLRGLCDRMDSEAFHPLTGEELSGSVAVRLKQYVMMINKAVDRLVRDGVATPGTSQFPRLRGRGGDGWMGRWLGLSDVTCLLRVAPWPWARDRATPLWLQVGVYKGEHKPAALLKALGPLVAERDRVFEHRHYVDVAIDLPTGVEQDVVLAAIRRQLTRVAELLAPLQVSAAGVTAATAADTGTTPPDPGNDGPDPDGGAAPEEEVLPGDEPEDDTRGI
ncbi:hypothetical protein [Blastococcus sp. SYSU DS0541]